MTEDRIREIVREELSRALPQLLSAKEVAQRLAVTQWQVYKLLDDQQMTSVYIGRRRYVEAESLRSYVASLPNYPQ